MEKDLQILWSKLSCHDAIFSLRPELCGLDSRQALGF